jgi:hypothetical protein
MARNKQKLLGLTQDWTEFVFLPARMERSQYTRHTQGILQRVRLNHFLNKGSSGPALSKN